MTTQRRALPGLVNACLSNSCLVFCKSLIWLVTVTVLAGIVAARDTTQSLRSEFLMELSADLEQPSQELGETPFGTRHIVYVHGGGYISGPKIKGDVMRGGGDWYLVRHDGAAQLDVRITLRTNDGALIFVSYRGISDIPAKVLQRISKGEAVDASEYYFRTTPVFETASQKYSWLNRLITVGVGKITPKGVSYSIYAIK